MYIDSIVFPIIASVPDEIVQHFAGIDLLWIFMKDRVSHIRGRSEKVRFREQ